MDPNTLLAEMAITGIIAFIARAISKDLAKLFALLVVMPFIVLILGAVNSGLTIRNLLDLTPWMTGFVTNLVPIILVIFSESTGAGLAKKFLG